MSVLLSNLHWRLRRVPHTIKRVVGSRRFWIITGVLLAFVVLAQLFYPHDRALPFMKLDSMPIGAMTRSEITQKLSERYHNAMVITATPSTQTTFKAAGIKVATNSSIEAVVNYPWWQRIIPFSSVVQVLRGERETRLEYGALPLSQWSKSVAEQCQKKPVDASIAVAGAGELTLVPSKNGTSCDEQKIIDSLKNTKASPELKVDTRYKVVQPKRSNKQVSEQLAKLRKVLTEGITVDVMGTRTTADAKTITSWLIFTDGTNGELLADVDPAKVQPFIDQLQRPIYIAPGTTVVSLRDGQEIGRQAGAPGRGLDSAKLLDSFRTQLRAQKSTLITAATAAIAPREEIRRSYTNNAAGLQALLNHLVSSKDMAISIREMSGQGRALSANGDKTYHPASTYKLFIAYSIIKRIEANQLSWTDQIEGKTVDECMTRMIVNSDNACPEAFADKFSWKTVQDELKSLGMSRTNLNSPSPISTVNDQALFLQKLESGQLMRPENKNKLIDLMKRQVYRNGIPAGTSAPVADKVGFLGGILHDSAIIYSPHGTYVLSIYSNGGSWGNIAAATRQIDQLVNS